MSKSKSPESEPKTSIRFEYWLNPPISFSLVMESFFRWYDLWIGAYYDRKAKRLYVCPIPMVGFWIELRRAPVDSEENPTVI